MDLNETHGKASRNSFKKLNLCNYLANVKNVCKHFPNLIQAFFIITSGTKNFMKIRHLKLRVNKNLSKKPFASFHKLYGLIEKIKNDPKFETLSCGDCHRSFSIFTAKNLNFCFNCGFYVRYLGS